MLDDDDADDVYCAEIVLLSLVLFFRGVASFIGAYGERDCESMGPVFMC